jgi:hypothetical protein
VGPEEPLSSLRHPEKVASHRPRNVTLEQVRRTDARVIGEIGCYEGTTSRGFAEFLGGEGELHLFDFEDNVEKVSRMLAADGYTNVVPHGNSRKLMDSYNWSLMKVLRENDQPIFDYVFIDGAHVWGIDALAFFLVDKLLKPGGYVDFDDYNWSLERSPTYSPRFNAATQELYTDEQIGESHIKLIVELLVKRDPRYEEVLPKRIYRKVASP